MRVLEKVGFRFEARLKQAAMKDEQLMDECIYAYLRDDYEATLSNSITGKVQRVGFRRATCDEALRLGLQGWVCNEKDGSVYLEAEGSHENLKNLTKWCHIGPRWARVDSVSIQEIPVIHEHGRILHQILIEECF